MVMTISVIIRTMQRGNGSGCLGELKSELERGAASHVGTGKMSGQEAAATWRIRGWTTEKAGVDTAGFADAVEALEKEPKDAQIELFHFKSPGKVFTVLAVGDRVLGCIRVSSSESGST